jgi:hypothetical protein
MNFCMQTLATVRHPEWFSRFSGSASMVVAASVGLVMAWWVPQRMQAVVENEGGRGESLIEEVPAPGVDVSRLVAFCAANTTADRAFVVFGSGTVVLVDEPCVDPVAEGLRILKSCAAEDTAFLTKRTDQGDMMVTFRDALFHWVPEKELFSLEIWAAENLDRLFSASEQEKISDDWMPSADARIGLIARMRLLEDAETLKVVKVIRPKVEEPITQQ